jgi:hypothetical protein
MIITINKKTAKLLMSVIYSMVISNWLKIEDKKVIGFNYENMKRDEVTKDEVTCFINLHQNFKKKMEQAPKQKTTKF